MQHSFRSGPKPRQRHHSFDEGVDEAANLLAREFVEIEAERPIEENEPVEQVEAAERDSSAFEQE